VLGVSRLTADRTLLSPVGRLGLSSTRVTDAGLKHVRGLTQLREVELKKTSVTYAEVKELQKALPKLEIEG
jgi:hypothetical protein